MRLLRRLSVAAVVVAALLVTGCGDNAPETTTLAVASDATISEVSYSLPSWDFEDMVRRADAVVIGEFTDYLGDKEEPGLGETPNFNFAFKDYAFAVERAVYPADFPDAIAILVEAGITATGNNIVEVAGDPLLFQPEERVLLFLESLEGDKFAEGVGRPVPKGFVKKDYYQVIVGSKYGKLLPDGDKWKDSRSRDTFTIKKLEKTIKEYKDN